MTENIILFGVGLFLLIISSNYLIQSSSQLANLLQIRPFFIGLTIIAIGTSAPEAGISIVATIKKTPQIVLSTIIGSNLANIGLILGISGIIKPIKTSKVIFRFEIPFLIITSILLLVFAWDLKISKLEGVIFLLLLIFFYILSYRGARKNHAILKELSEVKLSPLFQRLKSLPLLFSILVASLIFLIWGANLMVKAGVSIAHYLKISVWIIGITSFAIGTSLPELATAFSAIFRKSPDISTGNIIGSNIFNILFVLGIIAIIRPIPVPKEALGFELPFLIMLTVILAIFMRTGKSLSSKEALVLLIAYLTFLIYTFSS